MSIGGNKSKSRSQQQSVGFDQSYGLNLGQSYLDPAQQANQQALVGQFMGNMDTSGIQAGLAGGQGLVNQAAAGGGFGGDIRNLRSTLGTAVDAWRQGIAGGQSQLGQLRGAAAGARNQFAQFAQQNNPYINSQVQQFGQDIAQQYREMLPGIGGRAQMAGQRGGSRQGIAEGLAARSAMDQFARGATNLRSQAYGQQQQAAGQLAGLTQQGALAQQQLGQAGQMGMAGLGLSGLQGLGGLQQSGLGLALGAMPGLAQAQLAAQFTPFQVGAGVIGSPSVLSSSLGMQGSQGYRMGQGFSSGNSGGFNFAL